MVMIYGDVGEEPGSGINARSDRNITSCGCSIAPFRIGCDQGNGKGSFSYISMSRISFGAV